MTTTEHKTPPARSRFVAGLAIHPGEFLREDFLLTLDISQNRLALAMGVPPIRVSEIVNGKRSITPDTAIRLAACLGTTAEYWLNLQSAFDLAFARNLAGSGYASLRRITPIANG